MSLLILILADPFFRSDIFILKVFILQIYYFFSPNKKA